MIALALLAPLGLLFARGRLWLLPLAPLPALVLALQGPVAAEAPALLLGVSLGAEGAGLLLLGVTAALWSVAGLYAALAMPGRPAGFAAFWGVALAGNLGVFLAVDAAGFYLAFAAVSLAAWGLVVHDRTPEALRAGRVYLLLAVLGEVCLLAGLILGAQAAGSLSLADIRAAGAGGPAGIALLIAGLGIKAGLIPLHVWLPLAHPAAPVAASAVLSGAIVKAGIFGALGLLPPGAGPALAGLGFAGAFAAALYGLSQTNLKAVLAYSTVSQMSLLLALIGCGAGPAAAALLAAHHALAKGALFLAAGAGRARTAATLAALSLAGAPLTGGALAKAAAKPGLPGWAETALSLSGITTTLLLVWFLSRLYARPAGKAGPAALALLPALAALGLPWLIAPAPPDLIAAAWPVALGLALAALIRRPLPPLPPGDLLALLPAARPSLRLPRPPDTAPFRRETARLAAAAADAIARLETALLLWRWAGLLLLSLLLGLALAAG